MSLSNPTNPPILNEHVATRVSTGLVFAVDENQTKVNQIHGINPVGSVGSGIPKPVTNVTASIANASTGATVTLSVRFQRNPSDKNFAGVNIYAKGYQGNNTPVQVGGGQDSPCTVILNNTGEAVRLIVQSVGNGGVSPLASSPTYGIKLPKNSNGGVGTQTITNLTKTQVQAIAPPTLVTITVLPTAMPWNQTINSGSPFGSNDGTAATPSGLTLVPGQKIAVAYVSGGVKASSLSSQTTDLQGDPSPSPAPGPPFTPSHYVSGSTLKVAGLVGAFVDAFGVVKGFFDLSGGSGSVFTVPAGASRVQFGINDTLYIDNTGPGYTIVVAIVALSVAFEVGGTLNAEQDTLNLVAGSNITISNTSGGDVEIAAAGGGGTAATYGPRASLPGSGSAAGERYVSTDSDYNYEWDGSNWRAYHHGDYVNDPSVDSTFVRKTTNTVTGDSIVTSFGGARIKDGTGSGLLAYVKPVTPSSTLKVRIGFQYGLGVFKQAGPVIYNSNTGKWVMFQYNGGGTSFAYDRYQDVTGFISTVTTIAIPTVNMSGTGVEASPSPNPHPFKKWCLDFDGTNWYLRLYQDAACQVLITTLFNEALTTWIGTNFTHIGIGINPVTGDSVLLEELTVVHT